MCTGITQKGVRRHGREVTHTKNWRIDLPCLQEVAQNRSSARDPELNPHISPFLFARPGAVAEDWPVTKQLRHGGGHG
jgi:hypothetical protein